VIVFELEETSAARMPEGLWKHAAARCHRELVYRACAGGGDLRSRSRRKGLSALIASGAAELCARDDERCLPETLDVIQRRLREPRLPPTKTPETVRGGNADFGKCCARLTIR